MGKSTRGRGKHQYGNGGKPKNKPNRSTQRQLAKAQHNASHPK